MRYLLILPILLFTIQDSFNLPLHFGLGLSLKNLALYLVGLMLALRMVLRGGYRFELPLIHICFAVLITYALFSVLVASLIVRYEGYHVVESLITLKATLIESALVFGLFFYGTRTVRDGVFLTTALVAAVTVANVISIASMVGYVDIPGVAATEQGGRATGAFGDSNETAALIAAIIPAYVAIARSSEGLWSLVSIAGAISSVALLLMTASRGAVLAMLIAYPWTAYVFRRYVSWRQVLLWVGALIALGVVILTLAGPHFVGLFLERFVTQQAGSSDVGMLSAGRTAIWARGLSKMMAAPLTLITGFGWNAWDSMGFYWAAHNEYLLIWFELGLVGLCSYLFLLLRTLSTVRSAVDSAGPLARGHLMAFVFGFGAFLIAQFFVNINQPWPYVWAYAGVSLRLALVGVEANTAAPAGVAGGGERGNDLRGRVVIAGGSRLRRAAVSAQPKSRRYDPSGATPPTTKS
jgi:O-antigen ligase